MENSPISLAVCPHDTVRNAEGWYRLVQYIATHLERHIDFQLAFDFTDFHHKYSRCDLSYANPSDALVLMTQHGYIPLVRPQATFDEAVLLAAHDAPAEMDALNGAHVATVENLLPTRLALKTLRDQQIAPAKLIGCDSWLGVVRAVYGGVAPYGIVYRDAYEELSADGKAMVNLISTTNHQAAFHMILGHVNIARQVPQLVALLESMAGSEDGRSVLRDLGIPAWQAVSKEALLRLRTVALG